jgi:sugar/nucleoside kinase (ribokinase family)
MIERRGILAAGNWTIDEIKIIDSFPEQDGLANICEEKSNNGGAAYNLLKDLSYLKTDIKLEGCGLVGNDQRGKHIINECKNLGIDTTGIITTRKALTSHTDVMTVASTGRRTFFTNSGANSLFSPEHIYLERSDSRIFHLAYMLLLKQFDKLDGKGRTKASTVFENAKKLGFYTSSDVISESSNRFKNIIPPSLPFIDFLFINEYEAGKLSGHNLIKKGNIDLKQAEKSAHKIASMGVNQYVILHFPQGVVVADPKGIRLVQPALDIPHADIRGSAGAGDAFAAGVLLGIHKHWSLDKCIKTGVLCAASSLFDESCSEGILPLDELNELELRYDYRSLP